MKLSRNIFHVIGHCWKGF